jgi:hypothetical protein
MAQARMNPLAWSVVRLPERALYLSEIADPWPSPPPRRFAQAERRQGRPGLRPPTVRLLERSTF